MAKKVNPNDDEPQEENINNESDDTFGLPEVEYEPLKREEPVEEESVPVEEPVYEKPYSSSEESNVEENALSEEVIHDEYGDEPSDENKPSAYSYMQQDKPSMWPKVVLIVLLVIAAGGALWYFTIYQPKQKKIAQEKALAESKLRAEAEKKRLAQQALEERKRQDEQRRADSLANLKKEGTIERLTGRTGQYYVVAASAIDDDLLMDLANKLVKQGTQVRLIPPFGKDARFYRLAVDAKETYADAQTAADGLKGGDFGNQLWVIKY